MTIHCASGDRELGFHTLAVNEQFQWDLCARARTKYFCHFWWGSKQKAFDVFTAGFFYYKKYVWAAKEDGIYSTHEDFDPLTKKFNWD
ncbi:hypothetical protein CASFOL_006352 [Castilleja foliolosa]|uniref:S-protein homolog n=1 Tax=Castilleja foliolosa TaxID=1961234 RepID=A0ABD3E719_9LAMI